jgi:hypothetical protein
MPFMAVNDGGRFQGRFGERECSAPPLGVASLIYIAFLFGHVEKAPCCHSYHRVVVG